MQDKENKISELKVKRAAVCQIDFKEFEKDFKNGMSKKEMAEKYKRSVRSI